ncbi:MAG: ATP-binding protein [Bacteroides intestinalis]|nr:ATP-binding protein [Bacteroides intestinalis]
MELNTLVDDIFNSHYKFYSSLQSETVKQQAGQMCQVEADYQGRVLYELIQNAVDRADHRIKVVLEGNRLLVGNDGQRLTFRNNYDYQGGSVSRGDFQALCSISTSAKEIKNSIGNKGVGFKSTFSASATGYVNVHTSGKIIGYDTPVPISFRLYNLFDDKEELNQLPLADDIKVFIARNIDISQKENSLWGVPGYYFPVQIPLAQEDKINDWFKEGFVTVIEIPVENSKKQRI